MTYTRKFLSAGPGIAHWRGKRIDTPADHPLIKRYPFDTVDLAKTLYASISGTPVVIPGDWLVSESSGSVLYFAQADAEALIPDPDQS